VEMTGSEAIVRILERAGVEYVFGLCGHANLSILDALESSSIRFVSVRHEQNAAHMADAYFRFSHKPGVVLTTIGPGLTNAVTGILEAAMDSSGVVLISGNVPSYMLGREAFQEVCFHADGAQADIYRPFVKRAWRVADGASIPFVMHRAFNYALEGRPGPVIVDVPMNYFSEVRDFEVPDISKHRPTGARIRGDKAEIERAVRLLIDAERPLIHAGYGTVLSDASEDIVALADYLGIPVTTSMLAQGVIDKLHPLSGGYPGVTGTPTGNALAHEADVVLALGTRFSELETSSWNPRYAFQFGDLSALIQVDLDPHEIGRCYPVEVGIVGDAKAVLIDMLTIAKSMVERRPWQGRSQVKQLQEAAVTWQAEREQIWCSDEIPIRIERVLKAMTETVPDDSILLVDAGTFRHGVGQYFPIRNVRSWFLPSGLGTMGGSMGAALGAKLACPNKVVVALIGDGGFTANMSALSTVVEAGISVVYIVLNNYAFDSIRAYQHIHYDSRVYGTDFRDPQNQSWNPDLVKIAEAHGIDGVKVNRPDGLEPALQQALTSGRPYVVEVVVGPTRIRGTGHWDVGEVLRQEGEYKRERLPVPQALMERYG
jgi:acetolactate synthase I/II/III large subunit